MRFGKDQAALAKGFWWMLVVAVFTPPATLALDRWRVYKTGDGLPEEWVSGVTVGPSGRVFITHGDVRTFEIYDGYRFQPLPSPGKSMVVREGPGGQLWSLTPGRDGIQILDQGKWVSYSLQSVGAGPDNLVKDSFLPWAEDRVLLAFRNQLVEFQRAGGKLSILKDAAQTGLRAITTFDVWPGGGGAWAGGAGGILRLRRGGNGELQIDLFRFPPGGEGWTSRHIFAESPQEVFVSAVEKGTCHLLRWRAGAWTQLATSSHELHGWRASADGWWRAEITTTNLKLYEGLSASVAVTATQDQVFSGKFQGVVSGGNGSFWLATSNGLAHYLHGLWRTPPDLASYDGHASPIVETRAGLMLVAFDTALLRRRNDVWTSLPLPRGFDGNVLRPNAMAELSDGGVALGTGKDLLVFRPETDSFQMVPHPLGRHVTVIQKDGKGGVWVQTTPDRVHYRLERFDGRRFHTYFDAGDTWKTTSPRTVIETIDGTVLFAPHDGGYGSLRDGVFQPLSKQQQFTEEAPLTMAEISPGVVWFGCRNRIVEFDGRRWRTVLDATGTVRSILVASNGAVWATSATGVHRYENGSWITNGQAEGVPAGTFGILEDRDGAIWVTTTAGIARRYPEADNAPPVTEVPARFNNREVSPHGATRIVFQGVDKWRATPENRLLFSFRLDNGPWSPFRPRTAAEFQALVSGSHRLEVVAADRNGNRGAAPAVWEFTVLRSWYREPVVILLGTFALVGIGGAGHRMFRRLRGMETKLSDKQTELETTQRYLTQLAGATTAVLYSFRLSRDGKPSFPYVSHQIQQLLGRPVGDVHEDGSSVFANLHEKDRERIWASVLESARTLQPWHEEYRTFHAQRGEIWVEGFSSPVREPDGSTLWLGFINEITHRKHIESELVMKSGALEHSLTAFAILREGRYLYANPALARLWGYSSHTELTGLLWQDHFAEPEQVQRLRQTVLHDGACVAELVARRADGGTFDILLSAHRRIDEEMHDSWLVSGIDITERKQAERELVLSRARLEMAIDIADLALWERNVEESTFSPSPKMLELFEEPAALTPAHISQKAHPDDRPLVDHFRHLLTIGAETAQVEYRILLKNGETRWIESRASRLSQPDRYLGFSRNVTTEREAFRAIETRRDFLETVLNYVPAVVFTCRPDGTLEFINQHGLRWMGSPQLPRDAEFAAVFFPQQPEAREIWTLSLRKATAFHFEARGEVAGQARWLWLQAAPQFVDGKLLRWFGEVIEIDARKRAEQEIQQMNTELEQRVQLRTAQLAALNHELESFACSVSHDLRAPLRGIDGWSLALLEDYGAILEPQARSYLDKVRSETQRMGVLIDDLLELSRLGRVEMAWEEVDLTALAQKVAARLPAPAHRREITIQRGLRARGDKRLLEVVLTNLLGNAAKFSSKHEQARIEFHSIESNGVPVYAVRDNGAGFDMAYSQSLFQPFQRLHRARDFPGTGVGLAIVQRMIHRHGGKIWAHAEPGKGAEFFFTLEDKPHDS